MDYVIFTSGGNDSIAMTQWAKDAGLQNVIVAYSNTGWGADYWAERMAQVRKWVESLGFQYKEIASEGMENLVRRKKAWPRGGGGTFQFCTAALKEGPAMEWLDEIDPEKDIVCMTGIMRIEGLNSQSARLTQPEWTEESEKHGGRTLWCPLVRHTLEERDALLAKTPFKPLPYRSKECYPCANANKAELRHLDENTIQKVEVLELEMGTNSKGNERVMFSPAREGGAVGIRAVVENAKKGGDDLFPVKICSAGWCGD